MPSLRLDSGRLTALAGVSVLVAFSLALWAVPQDSWEVTQAHFHSLIGANDSPVGCAESCPVDPFNLPGLVHWGASPNDTRWVPLPFNPKRNGTVPSLGIDDLVGDVLPQQATDGAGPAYTRAMEEGRWDQVEWARNKSALFIGSSHDRNNIQYFCTVTNGTYESWGGHNGGICHLPAINFTVVLIFHYGMVDHGDRHEDFPSGEGTPKLLEDRLTKVFLPMMAKVGRPDFAPDLIVLASLFWDDKFFGFNRNKVGYRPKFALGLTWAEVRWHQARLHKVVGFIRDIWGTNTPFFFRTRHLRKGGGVLQIFELDQSTRAVARELDIGIFSWGSKLEGYQLFYDNDQHFSQGPTTYIFGDMLMFYLQRAMIPGCRSCHSSS